MRYSIICLVLVGSMLICCKNPSNGKPASPLANIKLTQAVDSIVIIKHTRLMSVYNNGILLKTYHVCLGPEPVGKKHFRNDGKTPEGMYHINGKNPKSLYHKCLGISYPNDEDRRYAQSQGKPTGGDIKIHGLPNGKGFMAKEFSLVDWTLGCIALNDEEIDELYAHVALGICVNILP